MPSRVREFPPRLPVGERISYEHSLLRFYLVRRLSLLVPFTSCVTSSYCRSIGLRIHSTGLRAPRALGDLRPCITAAIRLPNLEFSFVLNTPASIGSGGEELGLLAVHSLLPRLAASSISSFLSFFGCTAASLVSFGLLHTALLFRTFALKAG